MVGGGRQRPVLADTGGRYFGGKVTRSPEPTGAARPEKLPSPIGSYGNLQRSGDEPRGGGSGPPHFAIPYSTRCRQLVVSTAAGHFEFKRHQVCGIINAVVCGEHVRAVFRPPQTDSARSYFLLGSTLFGPCNKFLPALLANHDLNSAALDPLGNNCVASALNSFYLGVETKRHAAVQS